MRLSDIRGRTVCTDDGENLGRVHEVHSEKGQVTALMCGTGSLIERWTARSKGRRIPWSTVRRMDGDLIVIDGGKQPKR